MARRDFPEKEECGRGGDNSRLLGEAALRVSTFTLLIGNSPAGSSGLFRRTGTIRTIVTIVLDGRQLLLCSLRPHRLETGREI
jgi:hypothetical protein